MKTFKLINNNSINLKCKGEIITQKDDYILIKSNRIDDIVKNLNENIDTIITSKHNYPLIENFTHNHIKQATKLPTRWVSNLFVDLLKIYITDDIDIEDSQNYKFDLTVNKLTVFPDNTMELRIELNKCTPFNSNKPQFIVDDSAKMCKIQQQENIINAYL